MNDIDYEAIIRKNIKAKGRKLADEQVRGVLKVLCETDLYLFAVRYFRHYLKKPSSKFHKYLYSYLEKHLNDKNRKKGFKHAIAAPRSNGKSSIISCIFVLWCICYRKKKYIVMISDTAGKAEDFLADVKKEILNNDELRKDFPEVTSKGDLWRTEEIITKNDIKVTALGTGNNIRGCKYGEERPDLVIFDDLESSEMVRSLAQREYIRYSWFNKDVKYVGEVGNVVDFLIVGTILGPESLLNALMDPTQYPDWTHIKFKAVEKFSDSPLWDDWAKLYKNSLDPDHIEKAEEFFKEHKEEMLKDVEVLWPEGDPYYNLMIDKLSDYSGFLSEKQNNPLDPRYILIFKENLSIRNFDTDPQILNIINSKRNPLYGAIDPSLGKNEKSDYSVIVTLQRDLKTGTLLVRDISMRRRNVEQQIVDILEHHRKYNYTQFAVEDNSFQVTMAETLKKRSREKGVYVPIKTITNYRDKFLRIQGIIPFLADGTVIFDRVKMENDLEYALGIEQLCSYSKISSKDDFPDALEMAIRLCKKGKFKMLTRQTRH